MRWTTLHFGKHAGRSLPQVILLDGDWFFWAIGTSIFKGRLKGEAEDLAEKATAIKIPKRKPQKWRVYYRYDERGRFQGFDIGKASSRWHYIDRYAMVRPYLDLSCVRWRTNYDKSGCRKLLRDFRQIYFGPHTRLTKQRCEQFFSDSSNFLSTR